MSNLQPLHSLTIEGRTPGTDPVGQYTIRAIEMRPYELLCLICMLGEQASDDAERKTFETLNAQTFWRNKHDRLAHILGAIQNEPDIPVVLRCNDGGVFSFQNPGHDNDSPEGEEFNLKRDLDILRILDLSPGATMPARSLLYKAQNFLKTVDGVCTYSDCNSCNWQGCPKGKSGFYERGNQIHIDHIIPVRSDEQRDESKTQSITAMHNAKAVRVRPHLMMCAVCQFGMGIRPPFDADNLPEFLVMVRDKPQTPVTLVSGADWMMCGPCKRRSSGKGSCVNVSGLGGTTNDLRDLNVLQLLDMNFGDTMPAIELYKRIGERIPSTAPTCSLDKNQYAKTSHWWDACRDNPDGYHHYRNGLAGLLDPDSPEGLLP